MRRPAVIFALLLGLMGLAQTQSLNDTNEGSRQSYDRTTGTCTFSWWGRSGMTYFVRYSEDLVNWPYLPLAVPGADAVHSITCQTNAKRLFMRLEIQSDPFNTDSDGDGLPDGWEVLNGLNPHLNDAAGDADNDGLTNLEEHALQCNPGRAADLSSASALSLGLVVHTDID